MTKFIALRSVFIDQLSRSLYNDLSSKLKQHSLIFDRIGILELRNFFESVDSFRNNPNFSRGFLINKLEPIALELQWLIENDIVFELTLEEDLGEQAANSYFSKIDSRHSVEEVLKLSTKLVKAGTTDVKSFKNQTDLVGFLKANDLVVLRLMAIIMETTKGITAVTTLPFTEYTRDLPNSNKSNVAQIVISKLPLPNDETPWEKLIDYRNDSSNKKNLLNLRRWIKKISTENLSSSEIEDELQWLINEFHNHMKFHKMKANTETLEVMVKAPLEIIEDLVRLKFSKIPEPFFALKKRQINLMEAELNAPGKEISYIIKTQEAFQSQE
ncbi:hypothetical protein MASR2M66_29120 [Chloroflexota bacterium]